MELHDHLVLFQFVGKRLGIEVFNEAAASLKTIDEGQRPDGQSNFYGYFEQHASKLSELSLDQIKLYDLNILRHEKQLAQKRGTFRLKYFQYLAALFTEVYLDLLTHDQAGLLLELNRFRHDRFPGLPRYAAGDLRKLAFWMATGAGKTLLLHLNYLQFRHYRPFDAKNIILLTPNETLGRQHLEELEESGIQAAYALESPMIFGGIQVLEMTKLYVDRPGAEKPKSGISLPTSRFEGPNLLFVDEGHKGTSNQTDRQYERAWRDIRESLTAGGGLTFEYSATFAQVVDEGELFEIYSRAILFEYSYPRFYKDGYGKAFQVANLKNPDLYGETLLMAGLLTLYEQRRLYDDKRDELQPYNIEAPLMTFIGSRVTAGPDVQDVVLFLDKVLRNKDWALSTIQKIMEGKSELPEEALASTYSYLKRVAGGADAIYNDLTQRLMHGQGRLSLHLLSWFGDEEIGLRTADSKNDEYFGVINVGKVREFLEKMEKETDVTIGSKDNLSDSLFNKINGYKSPINILIGAQKFREGWSSWRVSVMGLMNVGTSAGAQIIQLFGRGVRLRGKNMSLKRSSALREPAPEFIESLETIYIFGLKANYLKRFVSFLDREGVEPPITYNLEIQVDEKRIQQAQLKALELEEGFDFRNTPLVFNPAQIPSIVTVDLRPRAETVKEDALGKHKVVSAKADETAQLLPLEFLDLESLFAFAVGYKSENDLPNIYITRGSVKQFFESRAQVIAPQDVIRPTDKHHLEVLHRAAEHLLGKGLEAFYYLHQQRVESKSVQAVTLKPSHPNFPRVNGTYAYVLRVPVQIADVVEALTENVEIRLQEDTSEPLPRLHVDFHLYNPLIVKGTEVGTTPDGLVDSEKTFVTHLRLFWERVSATAEWQGVEIYLLRNLPKKGIGFFQTAGFYPDFLLWIKKGHQQSLAFVDPKGLARGGSGEKIGLLKDIQALSNQNKVNFPVQGYIVSPSALESIDYPGMPLESRAEDLRNLGVLLQDPGGVYIEEIMTGLKRGW